MNYNNFRSAYPSILRQILTSGLQTAPRGLMTRELLGYSFRIGDATDMLAVGTGRKLNTKFAAGDALSVIGGFSDHKWLSRWNPRIIHYGEHGAYGPRLQYQVPDAIRRLQADISTRRAVLTIWDPIRDLREHPEEATDYPCTVSCQLMVRQGYLDMHVSMRANDAWFGLPYDVFTFSQLQCTIAGQLGLPVGAYYHHATSLHLYEKDFDGAWQVAHTSYDPTPPSQQPVGIDGVKGDWSTVQSIAACIRLGHDDLPPADIAPSSNWYKEKLR